MAAPDTGRYGPAMAFEEIEGPPLLRILDGLVRRDGPVSGLSGEVQVGVRADDGYTWWRARLGRRPGTAFLRAPSPSAHVTWCLSAADADAVVTGRAYDPSAMHVDGDAALLARFLDRYTSRMDFKDLRLRPNGMY